MMGHSVLCSPCLSPLQAEDASIHRPPYETLLNALARVQEHRVGGMSGVQIRHIDSVRLCLRRDVENDCFWQLGGQKEEVPAIIIIIIIIIIITATIITFMITIIITISITIISISMTIYTLCPEDRAGTIDRRREDG